MPNNVYIGSRYLPLFDGAWSPIKSYEALIIVEYGNNSYTSKRPVPVNTPPTTGDENDPYWGLSGNYNGQISNLQQQINTNTSNITALENKVDWVTPQDFGAVGDGVNDDTAAINAAIATNKAVYMPKAQYKITSGITTRGRLHCEGAIIYNGSGIAVTIGANWQKVYINAINCSNHAGTALGVIPEAGAHGMDVTINIIREADKGIHLRSNSSNAFIQYCSFKFDWIDANYGIYADIPNNDGWINQNFFYGGHLNHGVGVYFATHSNTYYNANMFYNVGFEQLNKFIELHNATYFNFFNVRMIESENNATSAPRITLDHATEISIDTPVDFQYETMECTNNSSALLMGNLKDSIFANDGTIIFMTDNGVRLVENARSHIPYFNVNASSNITISNGYDLNYIKLNTSGEGTVTIDSDFASADFGATYYDSKGYYTSILKIVGTHPVNFVRDNTTNKLYPGVYLIEYTSTGYIYSEICINGGTIPHTANADLVENELSAHPNNTVIIKGTNWQTSNLSESLPGVLFSVSQSGSVYQFHLAGVHIYKREKPSGGSWSTWSTIV